MLDPDGPRRPAVAAIYASLGDDPASVLAELLELHAARTGQNTARHAARVLRGTVQNGRRGFDDTRALRRIVGYPPSKRHRAVGIVAKFEAGEGASEREIAAIAQRLRRKLRKMHEKVLCISSGR
jgi:hypothetical protein